MRYWPPGRGVGVSRSSGPPARPPGTPVVQAGVTNGHRSRARWTAFSGPRGFPPPSRYPFSSITFTCGKSAVSHREEWSSLPGRNSLHGTAEASWRFGFHAGDVPKIKFSGHGASQGGCRPKSHGSAVRGGFATSSRNENIKAQTAGDARDAQIYFSVLCPSPSRRSSSVPSGMHSLHVLR